MVISNDVKEQHTNHQLLNWNRPNEKLTETKETNEEREKERQRDRERRERVERACGRSNILPKMKKSRPKVIFFFSPVSFYLFTDFFDAADQKNNFIIYIFLVANFNNDANEVNSFPKTWNKESYMYWKIILLLNCFKYRSVIA